MRTTLDIRENYPLKDLTTLKIGGPARYFAEVSCDGDIVEALSFAKGRQLPVFVLGGGSNVLVSDEGFNGLVIRNMVMGIKERVDGSSVFVTAGAGEKWDELVRQCVENNWQGLECLSGIPGTAGAAPVQNIGAYGQSVSGAVHEVCAIDTHASLTLRFSNSECGFGYRKSIFNTDSAGRYIITSVTFRLAADGAPDLGYKELKNYFTEGREATLSDVREAVLAIRNSKGLLAAEGSDGFKSAGSFFKNPVIPAAQLAFVSKEVERAGGCKSWAWPQPSGEVKVSAACLIQSAGFGCGHREGDAGISPRHALCLINYNNATAAEMLGFAKQIQNRVHDKFGIFLKPEVQFAGFAFDPL